MLVSGIPLLLQRAKTAPLSYLPHQAHFKIEVFFFVCSTCVPSPANVNVAGGGKFCCSSAPLVFLTCYSITLPPFHKKIVPPQPSKFKSEHRKVCWMWGSTGMKWWRGVVWKAPIQGIYFKWLMEILAPSPFDLHLLSFPKYPKIFFSKVGYSKLFAKKSFSVRGQFLSSPDCYIWLLWKEKTKAYRNLSIFFSFKWMNNVKILTHNHNNW